MKPWNLKYSQMIDVFRGQRVGLLGYAILAGIILSWLLYFTLFNSPYHYSYQQDPESVYYTNSVLLSLGKKVEHTDHPGTILQAIGALIAISIGIDEQNFLDENKIEEFFLVWRLSVFITVFGSLFLIAQTLSKLVPVYVYMLPVLLIFSNENIFSSMLYFLPESFFFSWYIFALIFALTTWFHKQNLSIYKIFLLAIFFGIITTAKYNLLPVLVYLSSCIFAFSKDAFVKRMNRSLLFLGTSIISFFAFSLIFSGNIKSQVGWLFQLVTGKGLFGTGVIIEGTGFLNSLRMLRTVESGGVLSSCLQYIVLISIIIFAIRYAILTSLKNPNKDSIDPLSICAVGASVSIIIIIFGFLKHPYADRYLFPGTIISSVFLFTMFANSNIKNNYYSFVTIILLVVMLFSFHSHYHWFGFFHYRGSILRERVDDLILEYKPKEVVFILRFPHPKASSRVGTLWASYLEPYRENIYGKVHVNTWIPNKNTLDSIMDLGNYDISTMYFYLWEFKDPRVELVNSIPPLGFYAYKVKKGIVVKK